MGEHTSRVKWFCVVGVVLLALLPATARAADDGATSPFIFGLLGAIPVLLPLVAVLVGFGTQRGKNAAEFSSLREDKDKLERDLKMVQAELIVSGREHAHLQGVLTGLQEHYRLVEKVAEDLRVNLAGNYVHKEHLVLRLAAVEAKIEADISRRTNYDRASLKGPPND